MFYEVELKLPEGSLGKEKVLTEAPTIHRTSAVRKSRLGSYTDIGPNVSLNEVEVGDYT